MSSRPRRTTALLATTLLSFGLVAGSVSPAAAEPAAVDASTTVQLEGALLVLAGGDSSRGTFVDDGGRMTASEAHADEVLLRTDDGVVVELTGDDLDGAVSGSTFSGTISIPADVAERVEETLPDGVDSSSPGEVIDDESELGTTILEAAADLDSSLDVVAADVTEPEFDKAVSPRVHTFDVAVMTLPSNPNEKVVTDAEVNSMVSKLNAYWPTQSAGQVAGVTRPAAVQRIVSAAACDAMSAWDVAAARFGSYTNWYWGNADSDHLVVIAPSSCGTGTGLGSIGSPLAGGLMWLGHNAQVNAHTLAHEFGHNLGLQHSNAQLCNESVGCAPREYYDVYDTMGMGLTFNNIANRQLTALNVSHKARLEGLVSTDLRSLSLTSGTAYSSTGVSLQAASATSGVRGIRATDPSNGQVYFVEYRSGTGIDDGALYESGNLAGMSTGVRILKLENDGSSTVLTRAASAASAGYDLFGKRDLFFKAGQSFTAKSGKLKIDVTVTGAAATVTVSLGTKPTVAVSRIAGASRYQTAVEISKKSFPATAPVVYVATGLAFPDALAAAPAAAAQGGPLLLTDAKKLPAEVATEIARLKPGQIVVVGGTGAVSASVYKQLTSLAPSIRRDAGADRYETSRLIVQNAFPNGSDTAFVATARNFPDALAASAAAGAVTAPVVLVDGTATNVDAKTRELLATLKVKKALVAGGTGVVSAKMESSLKSILGAANVTRQGGANRYDTAVAINKASFATSDTVYLANGSGFADALAGAAVAGKNKAPLYTVFAHCVPKTVLAEITRLKATKAVLLGGAGVLTASVHKPTACK